MRILITNDDGFHAPGIKNLYDIACMISDDVWVSAPEQDQSGASHSLSVFNPLRMRKIENKKYAVSGTPTDCVILGSQKAMTDKKPDLILSGINRGMNVADDISYSGTVAGAIEGTSIGIPSIALSQAYSFKPNAPINWKVSKNYCSEVIKELIKFDWKSNSDIFFNVNFPDCELDEVKGIKYTKQGRFSESSISHEKRFDPHGLEYYWLVYSREKGEQNDELDLYALDNNYISITPLHLNMTNLEVYKFLNK